MLHVESETRCRAEFTPDGVIIHEEQVHAVHEDGVPTGITFKDALYAERLVQLLEAKSS